MFQALIQKAQGAVDAVVGKVLTRAAVAIPIVIAAGFGIAALTVKLSQAYGPALSYTMMAGLFVGISGVTAFVRSRSESDNQPVPEEKTATLAENVAEVARPLFDRDTLVPLLTAAGPVALPAVLRLAARYLPLAVMALIAAIFFLGRSAAPDQEPQGGEPHPSPRP